MNTTIDMDEEAIRAQATRDGITHFTTGVAVMRDGKVLVVRRAAHDYLGGVYELPGGGVDAGETFTEAAAREVLEETGLTVTRIVGAVEGFDYSTDKKPKVRQINFIVEVAPGDITLDPAEHDEFLWIGQGPEDIDGLKASDEIKVCLRDILGK